jgi:hypothetical protein
VIQTKSLLRKRPNWKQSSTKKVECKKWNTKESTTGKWNAQTLIRKCLILTSPTRKSRMWKSQIRNNEYKQHLIQHQVKYKRNPIQKRSSAKEKCNTTEVEYGKSNTKKSTTQTSQTQTMSNTRQVWYNKV